MSTILINDQIVDENTSLSNSITMEAVELPFIDDEGNIGTIHVYLNPDKNNN